MNVAVPRPLPPSSHRIAPRRVRPAAASALVSLLLGLLFPVLSVSAEGPSVARELSALIAANRDPLPAGSIAVVRADGDCLRVRPEAGLAGAALACVPSGSTATILPLMRDADGYRWQLVTAGGFTGWAADVYLAPFSASPAPAPSGPTSSDVSSTTSQVGAAACVSSVAPVRPGLNTSLSATGVNLALWGGGTMNALQTATESQGCSISAIYANRPNGAGLVPYLVGVPDFVNAEWYTLFAGGRIPAGTALMLLCRETATQALVSIPVPSPALPAPRKIGLKPAPLVGAAAVAVVDGDSGVLLYDKNAGTPLPPASLTKIATAILAAEHGDLDREVAIDVDSRTMRGSTVMGLIPGDRLTVRDLLHGLMMPSGNDAALAIGRAISGSDQGFVREMNDLSRRLGLTDTNWANPHGLNGLDHRTSAYDLAILSRYYMSFPDLRDVVSKGVYTTQGDRPITMYTLNPLFGYPGVDGLKTGYTRTAGNTIVTSRVKDGHRIFVVLLNDGNRTGDAWALTQWAFAAYHWSDATAAER